jgi:hypothetical protein
MQKKCSLVCIGFGRIMQTGPPNRPRFRCVDCACIGIALARMIDDATRR